MWSVKISRTDTRRRLLLLFSPLQFLHLNLCFAVWIIRCDVSIYQATLVLIFGGEVNRVMGILR